MQKRQYRWFYIVMLVMMLFDTLVPGVSAVYAMTNEATTQASQPQTDVSTTTKEQEQTNPTTSSGTTALEDRSTQPQEDTTILTTTEAAIQNEKESATNIATTTAPSAPGYSSLFAMPASERVGPVVKQEGEAYIPGNGYIQSFQLNGEDEVLTNTSITIGAQVGLAIKDTSAYTSFKEVTLEFEFAVPTATVSMGSVSSYPYQGQLKDYKISYPVIDGVRYTAFSGKKTINEGMPGVNHSSFFQIRTRFTSDKDQIPIKASVSIVGDPDTKQTTEKIITLKTKDSKDTPFNLYSYLEKNTEPIRLSGYYNKNTGAFYTSEKAKEAANDTEAVFGRFFTFQSVLAPDSKYPHYADYDAGFPRLSPTKRQSWDSEYYVTVNEQRETDSRYTPVLIDEKFVQLSDETKGFVNGKDMSINGLLTQNVGDYFTGEKNYWTASYFLHAGSRAADRGMSVTQEGSTLHHTLVVEPDNPKRVVFVAGTLSVVFVPTNPEDTESTKREIHFELKNMKVTFENGDRFEDEQKLDDNNAVYVVPRKLESTGFGITQNLDHSTKKDGINRRRGVGSEANTTIYFYANNEVINNHIVTDMNQLLKVDATYYDIKESKPFERFGGHPTIHVVYATKPDGSNWTSQEEMFTTRSNQLLYYDSLDQVPEGQKVIGILFEYRKGLLTRTQLSNEVKMMSHLTPGTAVMALDTEIWADGNDNKTTFYGSNGKTVSNIPEPSFAIHASDGGKYIPDEYSGGSLVNYDPNGSKYGMTYVFASYSSFTSNPKHYADVHHDQTYNLSKNERYIPLSFDWTVQWMDGNTPDQKLTLPYHFGSNATDYGYHWIGEFYIADKGASVTYNAQKHQFESQDPSFKSVGKLYNRFELQGATEKTVYFVLKAGDEENASKDIKKEGSRGTGVIVYFDAPELVGSLTNARPSVTGSFDITLTRDDKVGLYQSANKPLVAPTEPIEFKLIANTFQKDVPNYAILDVLPFDNDNRNLVNHNNTTLNDGEIAGTTLSGTYILKDNSITILPTSTDGNPKSSWKLYYTTDTKVRTAGKNSQLPNSADIDRTNPTASLNVEWKEAMFDGNTFKLAEEDKNTPPTSFMVFGDFKKNERLVVSFQLQPQSNGVSDRYMNDATASGDSLGLDKLSTTIADVAVVSKKVSGKVFIDKNRNGTLDSGEQTLSNVQVSLVDKLDNKLTKDVHGREYGSVMTNENGEYSFDQVPDADEYKVTVSLTAQQKEDYQLEGYITQGNKDEVLTSLANGTNTSLPSVEPASSALFDLATYASLANSNKLADTAVVDVAVAPIEKVDINVNKVWKDFSGKTLEQAPSTDITVNVLRDGEKIATLTLNASNQWQAQLEKQLVVNPTTYKNYEYTIQEEGLDAKGDLQVAGTWYRSTVTGHATDGFTVTNQQLMTWTPMTPATINYQVTKVWKGDTTIGDQSVEVELYQDGVATGKKQVLNAKNQWTATFSGLEYAGVNSLDQPHVYSVKEVGEVGGQVTIGDKTYQVSYQDHQVTNTLVNPKVELKGTVKWIDHDNQDGIRPEQVLVTLVKNGEVTTTTTLAHKDDWTFAFSDLDKYDENGQEIQYSIKETPVDQYSVSVEGTVITYKHDPSKTHVQVTKNWVDDNDSQKLRPATITVRLLADDKEVASKELSTTDNWQTSFTDLDKYANGKLITYKVTEDAVANYASGIKETEAGKVTVTNTLTGKTSVQVTKNWVDDNDSQKLRPATITVHLFADDKEVASKELSANDNWQTAFTDLDKYANGKLISYKVTEDAVANYASEVKETEAGKVTVTNTLTGKTSVQVTKNWVDDNDSQKLRPATITVRLLADDKEVASKELSANDNWQTAFTDLDKYANGKLISYKVTEDAVANYASEVKETEVGKVTVTNTLTGKTSVQVTKNWVDDSDSQKLRPATITVHLFADDKEVASKELSTTDNWQTSFTDLDKYANGKLISYKVTEDAVANYASEVKETEVGKVTVTNTLTGKTSVQVTKNWVDDNDSQKLRPATITVRLLADDKEVASKELSTTDNWQTAFTDLDKYANGKLITYKVTEDAVANYASEVKETEVGKVTVTNTLTGKTNVFVTKVWEGKAASTITVVLKADGKQVDAVEMTANTNWKHAFKELPMYQDGRVITYTIEEVALDGYISSITGNVKQGFVITNKEIASTTTEVPTPPEVPTTEVPVISEVPTPPVTTTSEPEPSQPELPDTGSRVWNQKWVILVVLICLIAAGGLIFYEKKK